MKLLFNEAKATQAATQFLRLRGGRISYIKLIKLLYLADREALIRWGRPITTDCYVSMDVGPVVSRIYDLIRMEARCQSSTAISSELPARPRRKSPPQKKSLSLWPFSNVSSRSNAVRRYAAGA